MSAPATIRNGNAPAVDHGGAMQVMADVITAGDLARLSPEHRVAYYGKVCQSLGINPLTKPFDYINLNGKLTLYATKGATDQLRALRGISVRVVSQEVEGDVLVVTVEGTDQEGRTDSEIGAVSVANLRGDALANARMKALTKAKRRLTLSMVGLGMLDESELETVPAARTVQVDPETGEIAAERAAAPDPSAPPPARRVSNGSGGAPRFAGLHKAVAEAAKRDGGGMDGAAVHGCAHDLAAAKYGVDSLKRLADDQLRALTESVGRMDAAALDAAWQWARQKLGAPERLVEADWTGPGPGAETEAAQDAADGPIEVEYRAAAMELDAEAAQRARDWTE